MYVTLMPVRRISIRSHSSEKSCEPSSPNATSSPSNVPVTGSAESCERVVSCPSRAGSAHVVVLLRLRRCAEPFNFTS